MKGESVHRQNGQSDGLMERYQTTFSIEEQFKTDYDNRPGQRRSAKRVEVPQYASPQLAPVSAPIGIENDVASSSKEWKRIKLSDTASVTKALKELLILSQQQVLKRLAKAWIKALCPKKQARFPYRKKKLRENAEGEPEIPAWWDVDICAHIEPDHVDKEARTNLCLYILRLRPSIEQLEKWNGDFHVPDETLDISGWTAFLEKHTEFSSIFVGLGKIPEPEYKLRLRQRLLDDIFYVAGEEERFLKGERDGDVIQIQWCEDDEMALNQKSQPGKRVRYTRSSESSDTTNKRQTRRKHDADHVTPGSTLENGIGGSDLVKNRIRTRCSQSKVAARANYTGTRSSESEPKPRETSTSRREVQNGPRRPMEHPFGFISEAIPQWHAADYSTSSQGSSPFTFAASFGSGHSERDGIGDPLQVQQGSSNLPERRDLTLEALEHHQRMMHVYNVTDVPKPHFATLPNTPLVSPITTTYESGPVVVGWPEVNQVAPTADRYSRALPLKQQSEFATPRPVAPQMMLLPFTRLPFTEHREMRSINPAPEIRHAYNSAQMFDYRDTPCHGLPHLYNQDYPTPEANGEPAPFVYPAPMPDANCPAAALPASVVRGFTGTSSGVGDGAWT